MVRRTWLAELGSHQPRLSLSATSPTNLAKPLGNSDANYLPRLHGDLALSRASRPRGSCIRRGQRCRSPSVHPRRNAALFRCHSRRREDHCLHEKGRRHRSANLAASQCVASAAIVMGITAVTIIITTDACLRPGVATASRGLSGRSGKCHCALRGDGKRPAAANSGVTDGSGQGLGRPASCAIYRAGALGHEPHRRANHSNARAVC